MPDISLRDPLPTVAGGLFAEVKDYGDIVLENTFGSS